MLPRDENKLGQAEQYGGLAVRRRHVLRRFLAAGG